MNKFTLIIGSHHLLLFYIPGFYLGAIQQHPGPKSHGRCILQRCT